MSDGELLARVREIIPEGVTPDDPYTDDAARVALLHRALYGDWPPGFDLSLHPGIEAR